jgi:hypothetical protein
MLSIGAHDRHRPPYEGWPRFVASNTHAAWAQNERRSDLYRVNRYRVDPLTEHLSCETGGIALQHSSVATHLQVVGNGVERSPSWRRQR